MAVTSRIETFAIGAHGGLLTYGRSRHLVCLTCPAKLIAVQFAIGVWPPETVVERLML